MKIKIQDPEAETYLKSKWIETNKAVKAIYPKQHIGVWGLLIVFEDDEQIFTFNGLEFEKPVSID